MVRLIGGGGRGCSYRREISYACGGNIGGTTDRIFPLGSVRSEQASAMGGPEGVLAMHSSELRYTKQNLVEGIVVVGEVVD